MSVVCWLDHYSKEVYGRECKCTSNVSFEKEANTRHSKEEKDKSIFLREYIYLLPKKCKKFIIFTIKFQLSFLLYKFSIFNYLKLIIFILI